MKKMNEVFDINSFDVNNDQHFSILAHRYYDLQTELIKIESLLLQGERDELKLDEIWCRICNADNRFNSFLQSEECNAKIDLLHTKSKTEIEYEDSEIPF